MSQTEAGPSNAPAKSRKFDPGSSAQLERFELLSREHGRPPSSSSTNPRDRHRNRRRSQSIDGQEFSYVKIGAPNETQSPTNALFFAEQLPSRKLYDYIKIWRSNFILSLDGGGVRGYSQLIILKALMNKVAELERNTLDDDGKQVESSFHPLSWQENKSLKLRKKNHENGNGPRKKQDELGNGNEKGKHVERHSDTSSPLEDKPEFYPYHYFDWIAGTSSGGLNAIMLGRLRMSVDECLKVYDDFAQKVFGRPRWASYRFSPLFWFCAKYSGDRLRDVVKQVVEDHVCEGEGHMFAINKEMCRTVVVAMKKNLIGTEAAHLFRTYDHHIRRRAPVDNLEVRNPDPIEKIRPADSSLIWEVARATSAAPSYFNTIKIEEDEFGDGGFGANNPSTALFWEVSQMNHKIDAANAFSVSIGTGISRYTRFQEGLFKKPIGWLKAAKKVSTDCEIVHVEMGKITAVGRKYPYFRFNVPEKATDPEGKKATRWEYIRSSTKKWFGHGGEPLDRGLAKIKLDEWKSRGIWRSESTKEEIERITNEYLADPSVNDDLGKVAEAMVAHRRARMTTSRWAIYALGIRWECPLVYERCPDETWTEESGLRRHLIEDHEYKTGTEDAERKLEDAVQAGRYFEHHH